MPRRQIAISRPEFSSLLYYIVTGRIGFVRFLNLEKKGLTVEAGKQNALPYGSLHQIDHLSNNLR